MMSLLFSGSSRGSYVLRAPGKSQGIQRGVIGSQGICGMPGSKTSPMEGWPARMHLLHGIPAQR